MRRRPSETIVLWLLGPVITFMIVYAIVRPWL